MGVSLAIHGGLVMILVLFAGRSAPVMLTPSALMKGDRGKSMALVYFAPVNPTPDAADVAQTSERHKLQLPRRAKLKRPPERPVSDRDVIAKNESPKMGLPEGSAYYGDTSGHDVRPALPIVSPDPPVARADLPQGLEGDVIVEITIDISGDVIGTRLLQGIGHGIEDKVIPVVQRWKFKPATLDGVPIASRQDVHFHYPS